MCCVKAQPTWIPMEKQSIRGFTLTELVITLAIGSVFLSVAVPSYYDVIQRNRISSFTNQLVGHLNLARSESIKRGLRVSLCPALNNTACDAQSNWNQGWLVFVDTNSNSVFDADEEMLAIQEGVPDEIKVENALATIAFDSSGFFLANQSVFTLSAKRCTGNNARTVTISGGGRLSTEAVNCPN